MPAAVAADGFPTKTIPIAHLSVVSSHPCLPCFSSLVPGPAQWLAVVSRLVLIGLLLSIDHPVSIVTLFTFLISKSIVYSPRRSLTLPLFKYTFRDLIEYHSRLLLCPSFWQTAVIYASSLTQSSSAVSCKYDNPSYKITSNLLNTHESNKQHQGHSFENGFIISPELNFSPKHCQHLIYKAVETLSIHNQTAERTVGPWIPHTSTHAPPPPMATFPIFPVSTRGGSSTQAPRALHSTPHRATASSSIHARISSYADAAVPQPSNVFAPIPRHVRTSATGIERSSSHESAFNAQIFTATSALRYTRNCCQPQLSRSASTRHELCRPLSITESGHTSVVSFL